VRECSSAGEGQVGLKKEIKKQSSSSSAKPEKVVLFYKHHIGNITPIVQEKLLSAKEIYSEAWVIDALSEAVTYNKPSWAYAEAILKRWKQEGKTKTKGVNRANSQNKSSAQDKQPHQPTDYTDADRAVAAEINAKRKRGASL
jgi:DnaD/phage-associated family protein